MSLSSSPTGEDRFIPGVYNYCDEWCSACTLAARCRVKTEMDAEAPPETPEAFAAQIHGWFRKALDITEDACRELGIDVNDLVARGTDVDDPEPVVPIDLARLVSRGRAYGEAVFAWQKQRPVDPERRKELDPAFPQDVIDHFAIIIGSKAQRAVSGLTFEKEVAGRIESSRIENNRDENWPKDSDGSAKAAILAAERSRAAWSDLRDSGLVSNDVVQGFEESLTWLIGELDRVFPNARSFVRPGFDQR